MKYKNKIIFTVITISIISSIFIGVFFVTQSKKIVYKNSYARIESVSEKYVADFNSNLKTVELLVKELNQLMVLNLNVNKMYSDKKYLDEFEKFLVPNVQIIAQELSVSHSTYAFFDPNISGPHDVWFADLNNDGEVERQEKFPLSYYDGDVVSKAWYYIPYNTKKAKWSDPYIGTVEADKDILYISYTAPFIVNGKVVAVLGSDYYFNDIKNKISSIKIYNTGNAMLLNKDNKVIVHSTLKIGSDVKSIFKDDYSAFIDSVKLNKSGVFETKDNIFVYNTLVNGWKLVIKVPRVEMFEGINKLIKIAVLIILFSIIIAGFSGYIFSKRIFKPIEKIIFKVKKIEEGNYDDGVDLKFLNMKDEIGSLANSIEKMRIRQKISFEKIRSHNNDLENKVDERTRELIKTNEYLEVSLGQLEEQQAELMMSNDQLESALEAEKNTKLQLAESEKIASLGYLVSGVAHEINTPVGNCITMASYIEKEVSDLVNMLNSSKLKKKHLEDFTTNMNDSAALLSRNLLILKNLINKFKELAVEKIETNNISYNVEEYLNSIVASIKRDEKNTNINFHILCDKDLHIYSDPIKLSQIIKNLIFNSIQHAFPNNEGIISIEVEKEYDSLLIEFSDDGIGMNKEELKNIFTPFYSVNTKFTSSGLGLNVVHNIITGIFHGEIKVESEINLGTSFKIVLKL